MANLTNILTEIRAGTPDSKSETMLYSTTFLQSSKLYLFHINSSYNLHADKIVMFNLGFLKRERVPL